jgi:hypothetical protein
MCELIVLGRMRGAAVYADQHNRTVTKQKRSSYGGSDPPPAAICIEHITIMAEICQKAVEIGWGTIVIFLNLAATPRPTSSADTSIISSRMTGSTFNNCGDFGRLLHDRRRTRRRDLREHYLDGRGAGHPESANLGTEG